MRIAGIAGVAGCALGIVGGLLLDLLGAPGTDASAAEIIASVEDDRTAQQAGMLLSTAAVSLWLVFGAGVWLRMRQLAGPDSLLPACFALGLAAFVTLLLAGFTCSFVLIYRSEVTDARLLYDLTFALLAISGAPTAIALGAYAVLARRVNDLPGWTGMLAALGAVAHVALLASLVVSDGFLSLEGQVITAFPATLFAWIIGTGIALAREASAKPRPQHRAA